MGYQQCPPPHRRPFVHMFYAALHSTATGAPHGCLWVLQIRIPLHWIRAFMQGTSGSLERIFELDAFLRRGPKLEITTDASPFGLGAVLTENGDIVSYLASPLTQQDRSILGLGSTPSSSDQQAAEALAILVALREWAPRWLTRRVCLSLRTDNVAALTTLVKLQPHSSALGIIARELALDITASSFSPDEAIHIPCIANRAADFLSRICDPSASAVPPSYLDPQRRHTCAVKTVSWWRSVPR